MAILLVEEVDSLLSFLMEDLDIKINPSKDYSKTNFKVHMPNFAKFVDNYCQLTATFSSTKIIPICSYNNEITGFYTNIGKGKLFVFPLILKNYDSDFFLPLIYRILNDISFIGFEFSLPDYLDKFNLIDEEKLIKEKKQVSERLTELDDLRKKYNKIKSILILKGEPLLENTILLLKEIGLEVFREENYEEDLWLLDNSEKKVIVEVKGTKGNVTRKQINDLDNHRDENKLDKDFPALLIVNTFSDANNFTEKEVNIDEDILNRTKSQKIKIIRALDLFYFFIGVKKGNFKKEQLFDILKSDFSGWIRIKEDINLISIDNIKKLKII